MRNRRDEKRRNETEKKRKRKERSFAVRKKKTGIRHMIRLQRQSMEKNICNSLDTQFRSTACATVVNSRYSIIY